jgi:riboflavin kinase/FMN adenylyltransferase
VEYQQESSSVALGLFDGVHAGHRCVLATAAAQKRNGLIPCAFTFPAEMSAQKESGKAGFIYPTGQKLRMLEEECGMEQIYCPSFAAVSHLDGESFAREILKERLHAAFVCCGEDFRFGFHAACDVEDLRHFGQKYGFSVSLTKPVCADGTVISSGAVRRLLQEGQLAYANRMLGADYCICQKVSGGAQLGRTIGFPTANQLFVSGQLVPKYGVYASRTRLESGESYPSLTNIGMKPTVGYEGMPLAETYIIGFCGDLYGRELQVQLLRFLRPEQKFDSVEALTAQMRRDLENCL